MRPYVLVSALLVTSACTQTAPLAPAPGPWRFSGMVSGVVGAGVFTPIAGAELVVIDGVNVNARTVSDPSGRYVFEALATGRFTLSISAPGYIGATPVVDLYQDTAANFALQRQ
jgi:hypothetical protein